MLASAQPATGQAYSTHGMGLKQALLYHLIQVEDFPIDATVESVMEYYVQAPLALRLTGQLMYGIVRIYHRKVRYLTHDCNEALSRLRKGFAAEVPAARRQLPARRRTAKVEKFTQLHSSSQPSNNNCN